MSHTDEKLLLILDKLSDIGERTARMEVEQRNIKEDLEEVKQQDRVQNQLLAEHIKGVETQALRLDNEIELRKSMETQTLELKNRVDKLEEAPKFRSKLKEYLIKVGGLAGAVIAIIKLLKYLGML